MSTLHPAYNLTLTEKYITTTVGTLSVLGSAIIILEYSLVDTSPQTPLWRTLMICLSVFDMQQGVYYISVGLLDYTDIGRITPLCTAIGLSNIFSTTAAYLCTGCIAYLVHDIIQPIPRVTSGRFIYALFLGYPFIVSVVAWADNLSHDVITPGFDLYGCYINKENQLLRWVASYIPLVLSWLACGIYNLSAYRRLKQVSKGSTARSNTGSPGSNSPGSYSPISNSSSDGNEDVNFNGNAVIHNMMRRLLIVPFGFVLLRLPDLCFRLLELYYTKNPGVMVVGDWAVVLQSALNPAQGTWNCVLLAIYSTRLRQQFLQWCCCSGCRCRTSGIDGRSSSSGDYNVSNERSRLVGGTTPYSSIGNGNGNGNENGNENGMNTFIEDDYN